MRHTPAHLVSESLVDFSDPTDGMLSMQIRQCWLGEPRVARSFGDLPIMGWPKLVETWLHTIKVLPAE